MIDIITLNEPLQSEVLTSDTLCPQSGAAPVDSQEERD